MTNTVGQPIVVIPNPVSKADKGTIIRTIVLIIATFNQAAAIFGWTPFPVGEDTVTAIINGGYEVVTVLLTAVAGIINWWKNNPITKEAKQANDVMKQLKAEAKQASLIVSQLKKEANK